MTDAKIKYENRTFTAGTMIVIDQANEIIEDYKAQGFSLTLRQIYYQFVSRELIVNSNQSYKRLGSIISDARRAGLIDWFAIVDRTRALRKLKFWDSPLASITEARDDYHRDLWRTQQLRIEVWIEKDALVGVIEPICQELDVPFFSCRGYTSDSSMWAAGIRALRYDRKQEQRTLILHLGDHDPSGIDMTRDIENRLNLFSNGADIEVRRIALTMDQIDELGPPPNPAKVTDSRFAQYQAAHGIESWELDALEPRYIANLIEGHILYERDGVEWELAVAQQEKERRLIADVITNWKEAV